MRQSCVNHASIKGLCKVSKSNDVVDAPTCYLAPALEGRAVPQKGGRGVFAVRPIQAGELLAVLGGEVLTGDMLLRLPPSQHRLTIQVEEDLYLWSSREGPADWFNHSCSPNAGLSGQIGLVAMRPIASGEEVCFDYAMCDGSPYDEFACACEAPNCRQYITGNDWRLPELWERYAGYFAPYLQRRIDRLRAN